MNNESLFMSRFYHISAKKAIFGALALLICLPTAALAKIPDDPQYPQQQSVWDQINAPSGWDITTGSKSVTVAVIDTGADINHQDLRTTLWTNPREVSGNGIDDDRNGYVDDLHGWNFVENNNNVLTPVTNSGDNPDAVHHGTLVAGLV